MSTRPPMVLVRIVTSGWYVSDVQGEHTRSVVGVESADRKVPAAHVLLRVDAQPVSTVAFEPAGVVDGEKVPGTHTEQTRSAEGVDAAE